MCDLEARQFAEEAAIRARWRGPIDAEGPFVALGQDVECAAPRGEDAEWRIWVRSEALAWTAEPQHASEDRAEALAALVAVLKGEQ